jgi:hypothetical protein
VVHEELGEEEHVAGAIELVAPVRLELEDRVEGLELQSRELVEAALTDAIDHLPIPGRAGIPVRERRSDQRAALVEEPVVDAPRVDTDRRDGSRRAARDQTVLHRVDEPRPVPPQTAVAVAHRPVRATVDDVGLQRCSVEVDATDPNRGRAEVDGENGRHRPVADASVPRSSTMTRR